MATEATDSHASATPARSPPQLQHGVRRTAHAFFVHRGTRPRRREMAAREPAQEPRRLCGTPRWQAEHMSRTAWTIDTSCRPTPAASSSASPGRPPASINKHFAPRKRAQRDGVWPVRQFRRRNGVALKSAPAPRLPIVARNIFSVGSCMPPSGGTLGLVPRPHPTREGGSPAKRPKTHERGTLRKPPRSRRETKHGRAGPLWHTPAGPERAAPTTGAQRRPTSVRPRSPKTGPETGATAVRLSAEHRRASGCCS